MNSRAPRYAYVLAVVGGAGVFGAVLLFLLRFGYSGLPAVAVSAAATASLGGLLALIWPAPSWRWGFWAGSSFALFFRVVFVSFLVNGRFDWSPAIDAIGVVAAGCGGAAVGAWLAGRLRGRPSRWNRSRGVEVTTCGSPRSY